MQNGVTSASASKNEAGGFYGTIGQHAEPNQAWALAVARDHEEHRSLRSGRPRLPR